MRQAFVRSGTRTKQERGEAPVKSQPCLYQKCPNLVANFAAVCFLNVESRETIQNAKRGPEGLQNCNFLNKCDLQVANFDPKTLSDPCSKWSKQAKPVSKCQIGGPFGSIFDYWQWKCFRLKFVIKREQCRFRMFFKNYHQCLRGQYMFVCLSAFS